MKIRVHLWVDVVDGWKAEGIGSGDVELDVGRLEQLSDRFDLMISSRGGEKALHVSPLGRGFGQR